MTYDSMWKSWHGEIKCHPDVNSLFCMETSCWVRFCWLSKVAENNFFQQFCKLPSVFPYVQKLHSEAESNIETEQFSFIFLKKTLSDQTAPFKGRSSLIFGRISNINPLLLSCKLQQPFQRLVEADASPIWERGQLYNHPGWSQPGNKHSGTGACSNNCVPFFELLQKAKFSQ